MLFVDIPTIPEIKALVTQRHPASVSIYIATTPVTQDVSADRIEFDNLAKAAADQLAEGGTDKRSIAAIADQLGDLSADDEFWKFQAHSLAVLVTPERIRTFRLPNRLTAHVEVSDRFHLKPLLRSVTFPHDAYVLALSENDIRFVQIFSDLPPHEVKVSELPKSASDALKKATINDRSHSRRIHGSEGQNVRLRQYARMVDAALRGVLSGRDVPLILAAAEPLASIYRSLNTYPALLDDIVQGGPDRTTLGELADAARPILDAEYAREIERLNALFVERENQGRATTDVAHAARAATFGAIDSLMVDIDASIPGTVNEEDGGVTFATEATARTYDIADEIAGRALLSGARVLGVRRESIPGGGDLAAILRYPI